MGICVSCRRRDLQALEKRAVGAGGGRLPAKGAAAELLPRRVDPAMANSISNIKMTNPIKAAVSRRRKRYIKDGFNLDLAYITDRLIAMGFPAEKLEGVVYRNHIDEVFRFLEEKHKDHYKIYNLCSERCYDSSKFHGRVARYAFEDHTPPKMELIQPFCEDVHKWLGEDPRNVAAVHCKAGKGRTGTMVCCYLLYSGQKATAHEALKFYGMARTHDEKGVTIPSQRRYVEYYAALLGSGLQYSPVKLHIRELVMSPPPSLNGGQCTLELTVSQAQPSLKAPGTCHEVRKHSSQIRMVLSACTPLQGDVRVDVYNKQMMRKEKLFHFWFNTFFVANGVAATAVSPPQDSMNLETYKLTLSKWQLDDAHKDKQHKIYSSDFKVELILQRLPVSSVFVAAGRASPPSSSASDTTDPDDEHWDSGEPCRAPAGGVHRAREDLLAVGLREVVGRDKEDCGYREAELVLGGYEVQAGLNSDNSGRRWDDHTELVPGVKAVVKEGGKSGHDIVDFGYREPGLVPVGRYNREVTGVANEGSKGHAAAKREDNLESACSEAMWSDNSIETQLAGNFSEHDSGVSYGQSHGSTPKAAAKCENRFEPFVFTDQWKTAARKYDTGFDRNESKLAGAESSERQQSRQPENSRNSREPGSIQPNDIWDFGERVDDKHTRESSTVNPGVCNEPYFKTIENVTGDYSAYHSPVKTGSVLGISESGSLCSDTCRHRIPEIPEESENTTEQNIAGEYSYAAQGYMRLDSDCSDKSELSPGVRESTCVASPRCMQVDDYCEIVPRTRSETVTEACPHGCVNEITDIGQKDSRPDELCPHGYRIVTKFAQRCSDVGPQKFMRMNEIRSDCTERFDIDRAPDKCPNTGNPRYAYENTDVEMTSSCNNCIQMDFSHAHKSKSKKHEIESKVKTQNEGPIKTMENAGILTKDGYMLIDRTSRVQKLTRMSDPSHAKRAESTEKCSRLSDPTGRKCRHAGLLTKDGYMLVDASPRQPKSPHSTTELLGLPSMRLNSETLPEELMEYSTADVHIKPNTKITNYSDEYAFVCDGISTNKTALCEPKCTIVKSSEKDDDISEACFSEAQASADPKPGKNKKHSFFKRDDYKNDKGKIPKVSSDHTISDDSKKKYNFFQRKEEDGAKPKFVFGDMKASWKEFSGKFTDGKKKRDRDNS